ncbi:hypothetical protein [Thalassomonas actiniarum]|uniref:EF-hand domain-containing protein n=1 Tax=Thalassomonas actiniarum TaxID=485447 RepID=A0AAE9YT12_9GAMM|nr:hypothetical protein [Thalassomonas actiniarum]WDD98957.1 hypothetical protein SG35_027660 [Thalassomonas actiniarum]
MFKHTFLSVICCTLLAACGGSSSGNSSDQTSSGGQGSSSSDGQESVSVPLDSQFYGLWTYADVAYVAVAKDTVTVFTHDLEKDCYDSGLFTVDASTETSLTSTDVETGEQATSKFAFVDDYLSIEEEGEVLYFQQAGLFNPTPSCGSYHDVTEVEVALDLSFLPPYVVINRDAQDTGKVEYDYAIRFDVNKSGILDAGDVALIIRHFKSDAEYPNNHSLAITELEGDIWSYMPRHQQDVIASEHTNTELNSVQVEQSGNRLTFIIDPGQHALLAHINEETPVQISTFINYPEPEAEVISEWSDGPWNWSSKLHQDALPDSGFTQPNFYSDMLIDDAAADLIQGESMWVDITSVKFTFTK